MLRVTLDTNVLDHSTVSRLERAVAGLPVEFACVTVSDRETAGTSIRPQHSRVQEAAVWDEPRWGAAVWGGTNLETGVVGESCVGSAVAGGDHEPDLYESLLRIISNGSFPKPGRRDNLTPGQRRLMRDAMILEAHAREGRDVLVSDDTRAFGKPGSSLRARLESLGSTRIMTAAEFIGHCDALRQEQEAAAPGS